MLVVVCYDVNVESDDGKRRLRRVASICKDYGVRAQNSVFECLVDPGQWAALKHALEEAVDPKRDSLRYYFLGANWKRRVEHYGAKQPLDQEGPMIV